MGKTKIVLAIFALAYFLRLIAIDQSYWLDETISVGVAKGISYKEIFLEFPKFDFHPPLFYAILKLWTNLVGFSESLVRLLPVIFGVATTWVVYKIAQELKINPLIAAILMATAPLHVYYSQEVRMYPLVAFFVSLSFLFFLKLLKEEKPMFWVLFSLSLVFFMTLDYMAIFMLPVFWIIPILIKQKKDFYVKLFAAFIPLITLAILWLPIFTIQLASGKELAQNLPIWAKVVGSPSVKELILVWVKFIIGRISFYNKFFYGLLVFCSSIVVGFYFIKGLKNQIKILAVWLVVPLALGFAFSFFIPAFSYFRFLYLVPAFVLVISSAIKHKKSLTLILLINVVCLSFYYVNRNNWREDWREAVSFVERNAKKDDIVLFEFKEPVAGWEWYTNGKIEAVGAKDKNVNTFTVGKSGAWYFEYLADVTDPQRKLLSDLKAVRFNMVEEFSFRGVGKIIYLRRI